MFIQKMSILLICMLSLCAPLTYTDEAAIQDVQQQAASDYDFVNLREYIPGIYFDIRYATTNNLAGKIIYPSDACYLRRGTANKLLSAVRDLQAQGYSIKIFDAYRPLSVQKIFWSYVPDERYVMNPAKGSCHNRGAAIDMCLVKADGSELPQQTPFDDFTDCAHRDYAHISDEVKLVRSILDTAMAHHGFVGMPTEWWHFDDCAYEQYPLEDIAF